MADVEFEDFEGGYSEGYGRPNAAPAQRWMNIAGALTSVALIIGVGVWGYRIAVRDVMGIPVVRAMEGPMRIAPDNPGGAIAAHQGLSVNDVAADGVASAVPDSLVLAPRPVELSLEDGPGLAAENPIVAALNAPVAPLSSVTPLDDDANVLALVEQLSSAPPPVVDEANLEPILAVATVPVVGGGVGKSLLPKLRPSNAAADPNQSQNASLAAALAVAVTEVDAASLEKGTRLVQLGAYDTADQARAEWDKLAGRFGELLTGKARVVQTAQSGGRTFFRLRAQGFEGEDDARRFCSALVAENAECIPVTVR